MKSGTKLGPYTIVRLIGQGGMGAVYEAYEATLDRRVALKHVISTDLAQTFENYRALLEEARTLAKVIHPNIVTLFGLLEADSDLFIAMEYVEGITLKQLIQNLNLSVDQTIPIIAQVLEGLAHLHERKVLHRDLKPGNIIVTSQGQVKIVDFGIAERLGELSTLTPEPGLVLGTKNYVAPEIMRSGPASPEADLWCLGAIFYEVLTKSPLAPVMSAHEGQIVFPRELLSQIPAEIRKFIMKLSHSDPSQRYLSARAALSELKRIYPTITIRPIDTGKLSLETNRAPILNINSDVLPAEFDQTVPLTTALKTVEERLQPEPVIYPERRVGARSWGVGMGLASVALAVGMGYLGLMQLQSQPQQAPPAPRAPQATPNSIQLLQPAEHAETIADSESGFTEITFAWNCEGRAPGRYRAQIAADPEFKRVTHERVLNACQWDRVLLSEGKPWWRVRPEDRSAAWTQARVFTVKPGEQ